MGWNVSKVEIELISDAGMYFFFEKDMRGGVSYISKRYSKASNKFLEPYELILKVWNTFWIKTMKDVLLVADVFEKFRNNRLKNYGWNMSHYLSTPTLSWNAILDVLKVELKFISNAGMYFFF